MEEYKEPELTEEQKSLLFSSTLGQQVVAEETRKERAKRQAKEKYKQAKKFKDTLKKDRRKELKDFKKKHTKELLKLTTIIKKSASRHNVKLCPKHRRQLMGNKYQCGCSAE